MIKAHSNINDTKPVRITTEARSLQYTEIQKVWWTRNFVTWSLLQNYANTQQKFFKQTASLRLNSL